MPAPFLPCFLSSYKKTNQSFLARTSGRIFSLILASAKAQYSSFPITSAVEAMVDNPDDGYDSAEDCWRCRDDMCIKHAVRGLGVKLHEVVSVLILLVTANFFIFLRKDQEGTCLRYRFPRPTQSQTYR